jgi:hypothetical protein
MRFRLMATYLGASYQAALGPGPDEVTLFAACPPPEALGFNSAAGHWRKLVGIADLDGLRQSRPVGIYRDANCLVLDDQGDRLHITYLGDDAEQARELGYWEIDREVFEMVVPRSDVIDLTEVHTDIPVEAAVISLPVPTLPPLVFAAPLAAPVEREMPPDPVEPDPVEFSPVEFGPVEPDPVEFSPDEFEQAEPVEPQVTAQATVRANSNGHRTMDRMAAWHGSPEPWPALDHFSPPNTLNTLNGHSHHNGNGNGSRPAGPRTARRERVPIQAVFAELADLAAIPQSAYALDDEVPGAMCLLKTDDGFEVFASSDEARHEVRFFEDEEAAYFYLFGVLAAEAVRNGQLVPGASPYTTSAENISKYLQARISHNWPPNPVRVLNSRRG